MISMVYILAVPRVTLEYGTSIQADRIKEGDDIYLTCHISASPLTFRESWYYKVTYTAPPPSLPQYLLLPLYLQRGAGGIAQTCLLNQQFL